ncbi:serine/threonine-protein kinase [Barrientosiimonas humi]|uniref:non-specific serine/threonine protein kinase n=1 Tax=Barrientosiimonas humi TaxID=999931 RepID=A0A542XG87_9MICO|nr:Stk1 family PASTA domain-containing Ser/Thr kinase [Barrientosiimonas humi]TQL34836.1 serine/threonine-protein kinase [Barrientosiimonas humi]CAG7570985.1 Serine/threonine-protein kinase PknB [Barrientosiimonas humi]
MTDSSETPRVLGGRYEVGELIGRGGMAEVHLGHDTRLGRQVAIKMLRADLARDQTFLTRFRREAQSAAGLNHHAIVAVYDSGEDVHIETGGARVDIPYIVMEYVDGKTLREILNEEGRLSPDEAARVTQGVLSALEYSHAKGIVHRDIKPANVMVSRGGSVKVMDFGIARALADASATMTSTQAVVGTARYLSPEQAQGEKVDQRSDLYSTGCLLFELLAGRTPFIGEPVSLVYQHIKDDPAPPSTYQPDVPQAMDAVTLHSLEKDRDRRYQTAGDFRSDLQAARAGQPISEAAVASLAALGADPTRVRAEPPEPATRRDHTADMSTAERPPRRTALWITAAVVALAAILGIGYLLSQMNPGGTTSATETVPSVRGMDQTQAEDVLRQAGFTPRATQVASEQQEGSVVEQDPAANSLAPPNSTVTITVSSGPGSISMIDVRGRTETEARQQLTAAGFDDSQIQVSSSPQDDTRYAKDQVASTTPASGSDVGPEQTITLRLSSGQVTVPENLSGQTTPDATLALNEVGLRVRQPITNRVTDDTNQQGRVLEVPQAGDKVDLNSEIELIVGQAPNETVTVPPPTTATPSPSTPSPTTTSPPETPTSEPPSQTPSPTPSSPAPSPTSTPEPTLSATTG